jgi:mRNA interferase ChpB
MKRGDIWIVDLEPSIGNEMRSARPRTVIILSSALFCQVTGLALTVPITGGGQHSRTAGYAVPIIGFGLKTDGVARCEQVRTLDLKARCGFFVETVPEMLVDQILGIVDSMLA